MKYLNVKACLAAMAVLISVGVSAQQKTALTKEFTVKGKVQFPTPAGQSNKIFLSRDNGTGKPVMVDSTMLAPDLSYSFRVKQDHPGIYKLNILNWDHISFWSDADVTVSSRGYDTAKMKMKIPHFYLVKGSSDNNFINQWELNNTNSYLRMVDESNEDYYAKKYKTDKGDSAWADYLKTRKKYNALREDNKQREELLMEIYKDRPVLVYALRGMSGTSDADKYATVLTKLDNLIAMYPWLTEAKDMKLTIQKNKAQAMKLKPGQPVPSISYPDDAGKQQGLEQYKGKYVLIDFWASWCGPCRSAIPKVKDLYQKNKSQGFDVVSVSIDDDKKAWRKAMEEEKMPWKQLLSDNKTKTMEEFQFSGIPTVYLVDPLGNIITKFTGFGPDTQNEIQAIIDKKVMGKPTAPAGSVKMASF